MGKLTATLVNKQARDGKVMKIATIYSRERGGGLYTVRPTIEELRFSKGLRWVLRKSAEKWEKSKQARGKWVLFESAVLGTIAYRQKYTGKKGGWVHYVDFQSKGLMDYEEMRHAFTLAIFAISGAYPFLQVDFGGDLVKWTFSDGGSLLDKMRGNWEIVDDIPSIGGVGELSRVVTRDTKKRE